MEQSCSMPGNAAGSLPFFRNGLEVDNVAAKDFGFLPDGARDGGNDLCGLLRSGFDTYGEGPLGDGAEVGGFRVEV